MSPAWHDTRDNICDGLACCAVWTLCRTHCQPLSRLEVRLISIVPLHCRAVVCWVDRVRQECDAGWPRKCVVFLASDSGVVRACRLPACTA